MNREKPPARRSLGGQVIQRNLETAGFAINNRHTALVETTMPNTYRFETILVQNAWNILPNSQFYTLLRPYPPRMQARILARRQLALFNIRRAKNIVYLSQAAAATGEWLKTKSTTVAPIHGSIGSSSSRESNKTERNYENAVIVPGSITWYKNPHLALDLLPTLSSLLGRRLEMHFIGPLDHSGCATYVKLESERLKTTTRIYQLSHDAMQRALQKACAVIVPSSLETLSLSFIEAATQARMLIANPIPVHRELALALGARPIWMSNGSLSDDKSIAGAVNNETVWNQWQRLGNYLHLERF